MIKFSYLNNFRLYQIINTNSIIKFNVWGNLVRLNMVLLEDERIISTFISKRKS